MTDTRLESIDTIAIAGLIGGFAYLVIAGTCYLRRTRRELPAATARKRDSE
jgi:hypothetical protein